MARRQHSVIARWQLMELGFSVKAIEHRIAKGRLHPVHRGVYAVGRPELTQHGRWMAAVLACGPGAVLSHDSAAGLWRIRKVAGPTHVSVPGRERRRPGIVVHRRSDLTPQDITRRHGIPTTTPATTLIDIAAILTDHQLESAMNEADKHDLITHAKLQSTLNRAPKRPGAKQTRQLLHRWTFTLTDSELERAFLPIAKAAGLPAPKTQHRINGHKVDFFWPDLGLVVETDGARFHRTAAQQTRDRLRDQHHTATGLTEPGRVSRRL